ncbi:hypothetical protein J121_428 [Qipengyuania citrea LAMA 915]|uniref:Uncharacterized protein n=1 Tax=Qipengyuania citrea LAMA 915 TaxID=1306953 RepID=A0A0L1KFJ5_9SPHN|nr:hypothetical protein [Qipengyuania citrea]KNH02644.1 hypothetical protein J121_428 [Qipengyuania citrea LAMA 915]
MTAPARISQQDVDRVMKGVARAGFGQARILLDLENRKIEVIIGGSATIDAADGDDQFDDEDR